MVTLSFCEAYKITLNYGNYGNYGDTLLNPHFERSIGS
jgi:hypothetical protein